MNTTKKVIYDRNKPFNELPLLPPNDKILDGEVLLKWGYASRALANKMKIFVHNEMEKRPILILLTILIVICFMETSSCSF